MRGERLFYYALAEKLGYASVDLMLHEMESYEVTEWRAYFAYKKDQYKSAELERKAEQLRAGR